MARDWRECARARVLRIGLHQSEPCAGATTAADGADLTPRRHSSVGSFRAWRRVVGNALLVSHDLVDIHNRDLLRGEDDAHAGNAREGGTHDDDANGDDGMGRACVVRVSG